MWTRKMRKRKLPVINTTARDLKNGIATRGDVSHWCKQQSRQLCRMIQHNLRSERGKTHGPNADEAVAEPNTTSWCPVKGKKKNKTKTAFSLRCLYPETMQTQRSVPTSPQSPLQGGVRKPSARQYEVARKQTEQTALGRDKGFFLPLR